MGEREIPPCTTSTSLFTRVASGSSAMRGTTNCVGVNHYYRSIVRFGFRGKSMPALPSRNDNAVAGSPSNAARAKRRAGKARARGGRS